MAQKLRGAHETSSRPGPHQDTYTSNMSYVCIKITSSAFQTLDLLDMQGRHSVHLHLCPGLEWIWMDCFAHWAPGRRDTHTQKHPVLKVEKNVTLMIILRELLSTAKTVEVDGKHLSQRLKGSRALQLSALLRQSQHTPAKLFLNNHPAVLKAVNFSLFLGLLPLSLGGRCSLDGAIVPLWQRLVVDKWKSAAQFSGFHKRPFCPMCQEDITSANDDDPFCVLCLVLQKKKTWLQKIFMISLHGWKILKGYA